ncbi:pyridine nucleotide-disulfide oxidoreductase domain-containing protein 1 [Tieghemostelium lacteum]|uniref:Pyridine nucleotide-disulfide oxidoreductase domain-containing protein 1 n=1 Tax=Tieghemostelium lacteum TaxID=361077 RepID=A0A151ZGZ1_TIELA|nr:pyridine nucleotide-disulfide oxidoreductase domain-containing protein 1 [Tieghemostelium lacteum]|eukprot:KYQ93242.1 pyridine nucleotide-disulfide oxidoreductase domain-containing protein 1 [Tieghemostelium lacteum]
MNHTTQLTISSNAIHSNLVVIGGGIAGITCAESYSQLKPNESVLILSSSPILKTVQNVQRISKVLETFDIFEKEFTEVEFKHPNIRVEICQVVNIDYSKNLIITKDKGTFSFDYLSMCTGARPNLIRQSHYVLGIRDTETIINLKDRLSNSRRIVVVGNGGIALELLHEIKNIDIIWSIKDNHIGNAFFDLETATFLSLLKDQENQSSEEENNNNQSSNNKNEIYNKLIKISSVAIKGTGGNSSGSSIGPNWYSKYNFQENLKIDGQSINVEYGTELVELYDDKVNFTKEILDRKEELGDWPVYIKLSNNNIYGCDFIISATGVIPNSELIRESMSDVLVASDGSLLVNEQMQLKFSNGIENKRIYAAGDVCQLQWTEKSEFWFQMKLWSQARIMGRYCAQEIARQSLRDSKKPLEELDEICTNFEFELFAHITKFFNLKVIMLGLYNGQSLDMSSNDIKRYHRLDIEERQFVRIILKNGRLQGAVLIGDTDLEETFENLILNQIDLSNFGEELLNPDIDIEDYFD